MPENDIPIWEKGIRKTPLCHCLQCGHPMNAAGRAPGALEVLPKPGDDTLCIKCGAVMKFAPDMTVRGMTEEEMDAIIADTEYMNYLATVVKGIHIIQASKG